MRRPQFLFVFLEELNSRNTFFWLFAGRRRLLLINIYLKKLLYVFALRMPQAHFVLKNVFSNKLFCYAQAVGLFVWRKYFRGKQLFVLGHAQTAGAFVWRKMFFGKYYVFGHARAAGVFYTGKLFFGKRCFFAVSRPQAFF